MATTRCAMLMLAGFLLAGGATLPAVAAVPFFNATCPGGTEVHADAGGPVYINGRETSLKRSNDNYYEARDNRSGITLSISRGADGEPQLSYTGHGGANGICQVKPSSGPGPAASTALDACNERKGEDGQLVTELPVGDRYTEVIAQYADGRYLCMLTNEGAVQSLTPIRKR